MKAKAKPLYVSLLAFIALAYLLLPAMNGDYLYTIQDNNVFINGHTFMKDIISHYGGFGTWAACYLTQFFYHPWLGSTIIIACWIVTTLLTAHLFQLKGKWTPIALAPALLLLFNLLDYGYWIYYAKSPGFAFQPTLLTLFIVLASCISKQLLHALHILKPGRPTNIAIPIALCATFTAISFTVGTWKLDNHKSSFLTTLTDKNFHHEMRMYRALDEFQFEDVISEMQACQDEPTRLMVVYKNIALMHTGRIHDMFKTKNHGVKPNVSDSLTIRTSLLGGSLIYYHFGQINYAYRWAMENSVQYGQSFKSLKMLARCAILNKEFDVAIKYLAMLKNSLFHREWAKAREAWVASSTLLIQSKEFQTLSPLFNEDIDRRDHDEGLCEKFILEHFSDLTQAQSPLLEDVIMCTSLWYQDAYAFCVHFHDYVNNHPGQPIPALYQEAAILLGTAESSPITLDRFKFDTPVSTKYNQFVRDYNQLLQSGIDNEEMGRRLKGLYGDTYWWYYYFCTDFNFY